MTTIDSEAKGKSHSPKALMFVVLAITTLTALYERGLNSGIPLYYDSIGYSATFGGTLVAVFTLASTVMRILGGPITDRVTHLRVLLGSLVSMLVGAALPIASDAYPVVIVSRVLQGGGFALGTNVMTVAIMGSASRAHIGRRVGIKGVGTSLGTMGGAVIATWLLSHAGYDCFYGFYVALMAVSVLAVLLLRNRNVDDDKPAPHDATKPDDAHGPKASEKASLKELVAPYFNVSRLPYMAISFGSLIPKGFCVAFMLIFAKEAGIAAGASFFVVTGITTLVCRLLGGNLFDSSKSWLLFPIILAQSVGFALLAANHSVYTLWIAAIGYGISFGMASPFLKALTAKSTSKEHWGTVNGELYFFSDIGKALGSFAGGLIIDATSKALVPQIALGISLFSAAITGISILALRHIESGK